MIAQVLDREFLLDRARYAGRLLDSLARGAVPDDLAAALKGRGVPLDDLLAVLADLKQTAATAAAGHGPEVDRLAYISPDRALALLQTALERYYDSPEGADRVTPGGIGSRHLTSSALPPVTDRELSPGAAALLCDGPRRLFDKFSTSDVGWAGVLIAEAYARAKGKHPFNPRPADPLTIDDRARVVLVGDWGTGIPRARRVGLQIRKQLLANDGRREQHVVHLGDVYYSGWPHEYDERFFPAWPVEPGDADPATSWCLNGNHDMYSGGYGYFDRLLGDPLFARQQKSSFFSLENAHWRVLGLDSSYDDAALAAPQAAWAVDRMQTSGRANILLTHHQPFSAYDPFAPRLREQLAPALDAGLARAWFWGHEHRCTVYKSPTPVSYYGCCLGHGGVPSWADTGETPPNVEFASQGSDRIDFEGWGRFGFATLDFDGPEIAASFYDEDGKVNYQKVFTAS